MRHGENHFTIFLYETLYVDFLVRKLFKYTFKTNWTGSIKCIKYVNTLLCIHLRNEYHLLGCMQVSPLHRNPKN